MKINKFGCVKTEKADKIRLQPGMEHRLSQKRSDYCRITRPTHPCVSNYPQIERPTQDESNEPSFEKTGSLDAEI